MLLAGRSSAAFIIEPGWESVRLVRLSLGGAGARQPRPLSLTEVIGAIRRGDAGLGWDVPDDRPADLDPEAMLGALREDPAARDRRLVRLAREVAEERERLMEERAALAEERASMAAERSRRRRVRPVPPPAQNGQVPLPRSADEPPPCWASTRRAAGGGRPGLRSRAATPTGWPAPPRHPAAGRGGLTVALNAARDLLLGRAPAAPGPARERVAPAGAGAAQGFGGVTARSTRPGRRRRHQPRRRRLAAPERPQAGREAQPPG